MKIADMTSLGFLLVLAIGFLVLRVAGGGSRQLRQTKTSGIAAKHPTDARIYSRSGYDITPLGLERIDELTKRLTSEERHILLEKGTEPPFSSALLKTGEKGTYTCRLCRLPLFSSDAKFTSGTGWPSFYKPSDSMHVRHERDSSHGMSRVEIQCSRCRSHLGHLFEDGPPPTGLRFCINSTSLRFFQENAELPLEVRPIQTETAYFAGGCFWGMEDRFQQVTGVVDVVSGYAGGTTINPTYKQVGSGKTGHAETVRVTYDPKRIGFGKLLEWFFKFHDPTQLNRQGPDIGTEYRSAIFAANEKQLKQAREFVDELQRSDRFRGRKIVTRAELAGPFYEAEQYHQDYHEKHGGSCPLPSND